MAFWRDVELAAGEEEFVSNAFRCARMVSSFRSSTFGLKNNDCLININEGKKPTASTFWGALLRSLACRAYWIRAFRSGHLRLTCLAHCGCGHLSLHNLEQQSAMGTLGHSREPSESSDLASIKATKSSGIKQDKIRISLNEKIDLILEPGGEQAAVDTDSRTNWSKSPIRFEKVFVTLKSISNRRFKSFKHTSD